MGLVAWMVWFCLFVVWVCSLVLCLFRVLITGFVVASFCLNFRLVV